MHRTSVLLLLGFVFCVAGCGDGQPDGDADADADGGTDADGEADADGGCDEDACDAACVEQGEVGGECELDLCECHGDPGGPWAPVHGEDPIDVEWVPGCLDGEPADLLEEVLGESGIDLGSFGYTEDDWSLAGYAPVLGDEALLSWFYEVQHTPRNTPCFASALVSALDQGADRGGPSSTSIAVGAWVTDMPVHPLEAPPRPADVANPLAEAVGTFITLAGGEPDAGALETAATAVPPEVQAAVAPVVRAMGPVIAARDEWLGAYDIGFFPPVLYLPLPHTDHHRAA